MPNKNNSSVESYIANLYHKYLETGSYKDDSVLETSSKFNMVANYRRMHRKMVREVKIANRVRDGKEPKRRKREKQSLWHRKDDRAFKRQSIADYLALTELYHRSVGDEQLLRAKSEDAVYDYWAQYQSEATSYPVVSDYNFAPITELPYAAKFGLPLGQECQERLGVWQKQEANHAQ